MTTTIKISNVHSSIEFSQLNEGDFFVWYHDAENEKKAILMRTDEGYVSMSSGFVYSQAEEAQEAQVVLFRIATLTLEY